MTEEDFDIFEVGTEVVIEPAAECEYALELDGILRRLRADFPDSKLRLVVTRADGDGIPEVAIQGTLTDRFVAQEALVAADVAETVARQAVEEAERKLAEARAELDRVTGELRLPVSRHTRHGEDS